MTQNSGVVPKALARRRAVSVVIAGALACGATIVCGVAVGAASSAAFYAAGRAGTSRFRWTGLAKAAAGGVLGGGTYGGAAKAVGWRFAQKGKHAIHKGFGVRFSGKKGMSGTDITFRGQRKFGIHIHQHPKSKGNLVKRVHVHCKTKSKGMSRHRPWE